MSSQPIEHLHPVLDFAQRLVSRLDALADAPLMSMRPEDKRAALVTLAQGRAQLDALALRLLADAERSEATVESGAGSAADWVAIETRQVRREARADLRLAANLETHQVLASAMAAGRVNPAQGRAIIASLDRLPRTGQFAVAGQQRAAAETHLVELAAEHDAKALQVLGRRVFEVIAPDLAELFEGRALEREEAEALRRTTLTMWEDDEGTCHGRFRLPARHGQMLTKMILAISAPARAAGASVAEVAAESGAQSGIDPDLPTPVRHGIALTQLLESVQAKDLPRTGGCGATIVVTMTLDQLMARLDTAGVCTLDTGGRISATEARRLACSAPASSRSSSAAAGKSSTSAANADSTPKRCAWRWACATAAAPPWTARSPQACATPTTTSAGPKAATPTSNTDASSAPTTTAASTTRATRPNTYPTARSASAEESEVGIPAYGNAAVPLRAVEDR